MDLSLSNAIASSLIGAAATVGAYSSLYSFKFQKHSEEIAECKQEVEMYKSKVELYRDKVEKKVELIANDVSAMKASQELLIKLLNNQLK